MELQIYKAITRAPTVINRIFAEPEAIEELVTIITAALQFPTAAQLSITIGKTTRATPEFKITPWILHREFSTPRHGKGSITITYLQELAWLNDQPFTSEEESFLDNITNLIIGAANKKAFEELNYEHTERKKELSGISRIIAIMQKKEPFEQLLQEVVEALPAAWQYPEHTGAHIRYGTAIFATKNFDHTPWIQTQTLVAPDGSLGAIIICYLKEFPKSDEGPFMKEERTLIENVALLITTAASSKLYERIVVQNKERLKELYAINQTTQIISSGGSIDETLQKIALLLPGSWLYPHLAVARITFGKKEYTSIDFQETPWVMREPFTTFDNFVGTIEIYYTEKCPELDIGPFLTEERDLISNIARLIAHFLNNYKGRNLVEQAAKPRRIASESAHPVPECHKPIIKLLNTRNFEQQRIKSIHHNRIRQVLLVASSFDAFSIYFDDPWFERLYYSEHRSAIGLPRITLVCSWTHAQDLLSHEGFDLIVIIPGHNEDHVETALEECRETFPDVHVFILANQKRHLSNNDNSFKQSHSHLRFFIWPGDARIFFAMVMLLEDAINVDADSATGLVRVVLLVEDSPEDYSRLLAVVYPALFPHRNQNSFRDTGTIPHSAPSMLRPKILLAHNYEDAMHYANKYASSLCCLISDIEFEVCGSLYKHAGIQLTRSIRKLCPDLPCLLNSSEENHALEVQNTPAQFVVKARAGSLNTIISFIKTSLKVDKKVIRKPDTAHEPFSILAYQEKQTRFLPGTVTTLSGGSLGGKGRGAAFLSALLHETPKKNFPSGITICTPTTILIGAHESARILALPAIQNILHTAASYQDIRMAFAACSLDKKITKRLRDFVDQVRTPLAVRSSGLFEDSFSQPFAGAFETYLIPNNHSDIAIRVRQLKLAIVLVYASLFRPEAQIYFDRAGRKPADEHMSVVIQDVAGKIYGDCFYPHISGVARSYNYYPVANMKPDEGVAVAALGLGTYVVDGQAAYRFSPKYPAIEFGSIKNLVATSQTSFFAVNLTNTIPDFVQSGEKAGLTMLDVKQAEDHGTLKHCASVFDAANQRIVPDLSVAGPRIINFADILKHDYIPLAQSLDTTLKLLSESFGAPVEIEWAVTLADEVHPEPMLFLLQVRPLIGDTSICDIGVIDPQTAILYSKTALGNGLIGPLHDVVIINPERFNRLKTEEMVREVEYFNRKLLKEKREYLLIGPGRWGTRDPSLGIPVTWSQISGARVLVEVALTDFPVDASLGSHFFHNLTAMNVGYLAVRESGTADSIDWDAFLQGDIIESQTWFRHIRYSSPLSIRIDGRKSTGVIAKT